jgi:tetratricopeptide (TPR) repeat protein
VDEARDALRTILARSDVEADKALGDLVPLLRLGGQSNATWQALAAWVEPQTLAGDTLMLLADLASDSGDHAAARRFARAALERADGPAASKAGARLLLAQLDAAAGRTESALQTAQELSRGGAEQRFALVDMLLALERNEDAAQNLQSMLDADAADTEVARRLALLALQESDFDTARARFSGLLRNNITAGEALFFLGIIAERRGEQDAALDAYLRLVRAGGGLRPRTRAAAVLLGKSRDNEARELLLQHASGGGQDAIDAASAWSAVLVETQRGDAAVATLDAALKEFPGHPSIEYQRGLVLAQLGRNREAIAQLEKYLKARPQDPNALNALGYTLADAGLQLPRAEQLIRDALARSPDSAALIDSLGWVRFRRGDPRGALQHLERAYTLARDAEIAAHWGEVLWVLDRRGEARSVWARGLARDPDSRPLKATIARLTKPASE